MPLKACAVLIRKLAVFLEPIIVMYVFAPIVFNWLSKKIFFSTPCSLFYHLQFSSIAIPEAITNSEATNPPKLRFVAEG